MFRFENPSVFFWLWSIPLLWICAWWMSRRAAARLKKSLGTRMAPFLSRSVSTPKRRWKLLLQSVAVACFIIAWARPQLGESTQEIKREGIEIVLAVDVSESMLADDVKPSRLAQAKIELARLVDMMPGNKTGVVAFAGTASLQSPLTVDPNAIKMYLESLATSSVSTQGTCVQCALETADDAFKRGGVATDTQTRVTRVILIASDGEDQEQGALDAAKKLAEAGTRVFTIAYGTEKGGTIPLRDGMGYLRGYKKDRQGQTVLTQVKGTFLRELAEAGKGQFTFATFGGDQTRSLVNELSQLEKSQFDSEVATQYEERFQLILLLGILLAVIELIIGERRAGFRLWKGRFEVPPA